jgi:hypothetical protein
LGILSTTAYDLAIEIMIRQATYGGQLLIYFNLDLKTFLEPNDKWETIVFKNAQIGIINHCNGSGDILEADIQEYIKLPYNSENVFLEKSIKYNWTYEIAGMCRDWCDSTQVSFTEEKIGEIVSSSTNKLLDEEANYNKTFKEGGCTFGDMDIRRHRKVDYINNYPCGNKCQDCGTFWID